MTQDNMDSVSSFQLMDLLRSEVTILREVLSQYSMEELFIKQGEINSIPNLEEKRQKLSKELSLIREKKKGCKARNIDQCDLQHLHNQIEALDTQIEDKQALLKSVSMIQKTQPKEQKKVILEDEAA